MKANSFENLIADQKFKIEPSDDNIRNFINDWIGGVDHLAFKKRQIKKPLRHKGLIYKSES